MIEETETNGYAEPLPTSKKKPALAAKPTEGEVEVKVPPLNIQVVTVGIEGVTRLVLHALKVAHAEEVLPGFKPRDTTPRKSRAPRDPHKEYMECFYWTEESPKILQLDKRKDFAFPARAFQAAMATAASRFADGLGRAFVTGSIRVSGEWGGGDYCRVRGVPKMRQDIVRQSGIKRAPDIRSRPSFEKWETELTITFDRGMISEKQLTDLLLRAGFSVGVGENRPEKGGAWGCFRMKE